MTPHQAPDFSFSLARDNIPLVPAPLSTLMARYFHVHVESPRILIIAQGGVNRNGFEKKFILSFEIMFI